VKTLATLLLAFSLSGCFLLRPAPTAAQFAAAEQEIQSIRDMRDWAIKTGAPESLVVSLEARLGETQEALRLMREAEPTNWLDLIFVAAGIATGTGLLGARALAATKWIHMGRNVVKGLDDYQKELT